LTVLVVAVDYRASMGFSASWQASTRMARATSTTSA